MMTKNFFYIAQYFTPEPYLKDIDFIKSLKDKGWNPIVITGYPNYPKGKIYEGYKNKLFSIEELNGIKIIRTFTFADHSLSTSNRILHYGVFGFFAALAILFYGKKNSLYYVLQASPFMIFSAYVIRLCKPGSKILLDIQDVFPENIRVSGFVKQKWKLDFLDFLLNNFYYKTFDLIITVSKSFKKIIADKGFPLEKILTLYNWSMVEKSKAMVNENFSFQTKGINIVYAGNIGVHQGLSKLSTGIHEIVKSNPSVFFHFFGDGTDFTPFKENLQHNKNVFFYGRVSTKEIPKYLEAADCLFLHLIKDPIYESIIPSKLQAYIEIGKPILAGVEGEARSLVVENNLGVAFESENISDFIQATKVISGFSNDEIVEIKKRSLNLYSQEFSRKAGIEKLNEFLIKNCL